VVLDAHSSKAIIAIVWQHVTHSHNLHVCDTLLSRPAQVGGMGFIHYNCTIAEQAAAVAKVKAHIPGFVVTPVCMKPTDPVSALDNLKVGKQQHSQAASGSSWDSSHSKTWGSCWQNC